MMKKLMISMLAAIVLAMSSTADDNVPFAGTSEDNPWTVDAEGNWMSGGVDVSGKKTWADIEVEGPCKVSFQFMTPYDGWIYMYVDGKYERGSWMRRQWQDAVIDLPSGGKHMIRLSISAYSGTAVYGLVRNFVATPGEVCRVSLNANGGVIVNGESAHINVVEDFRGVNLPWPIATSSTVDFAGWNTKVDGSGVWVGSNSDTAATDGMTLFAQWEEIDPELEWGYYIEENENSEPTGIVLICHSPDFIGELVVPSRLVVEGYDGEPVELPVVGIDEYSFSGLHFTTVTLPASIANISEGLFQNCENLSTVVVPSSVTNIGHGAFECCQNLSSIAIPSSVTCIGDYAFAGCIGLTSVIVPSSVTNIGYMAFAYCERLGQVFLPVALDGMIDKDSVFDGSPVSIYYYTGDYPLFVEVNLDANGGEVSTNHARYIDGMFVGLVVPTRDGYVCTGWFTSAEGGERVTRETVVTNGMTLYAHWEASACEWYYDYLYVEDENHEDDGYYDYDSIVILGCSSVEGALSIPSGIDCKPVVAVWDYAFYGCSGLTSVTIPDSVTCIGDYAFYGCIGLSSVTIGDSVTSIGEGAFCGCYGLSSVTIPNSVTNIGYEAFGRCVGLASVTIGDSVMSIGDYAFDSCSGLSGVTIPLGVSNIGEGAFQHCENLPTVVVPSSVTNIGYGAFYGCYNLADAYLPEELKGTFDFDDVFCDTTTVHYGVEPMYCSVTLNVNGGNDLFKTNLAVVAGSPVGALPVPTRAGYVFAGWFTRAYGGERVAIVAEDMTLYAGWGLPVEAMNTEDISFSTDGGWCVEVGTGPSGHDSITEITYGHRLCANVTGAGMLTFKCRPTVDKDSRTWGCGMCVNGNYEQMFASYQDEKWLDCSVIIKGEPDDVQCIEWWAYYGKTELSDFVWTPMPESMTITFETNGGEMLDPEIVVPGATYGELPIPNHDTLEFIGWYLDAELTQKAEEEDFIPFVDARLYARWELPVEVMSTEDISFSTDGGWCVEVGTGPDGRDSITSYANGAYWYGINGLSANVTGAGTLTFKCRPSEDKDSWRGSCYMYVNGSYEQMYTSYREGKWLDCSVIIRGEPDDVQCIEWWAYYGKTELSDFVWTLAPESTTIAFETNGAGEYDSVALSPSDIVQYSDILPSLSREGYIIVGWYLDPGFTKRLDDSQTVGFDDVTLYARWELSVEVMNTDDIKFSAPEGSCWYAKESSEANGGYAATRWSSNLWVEDRFLKVNTIGFGHLSLDAKATGWNSVDIEYSINGEDTREYFGFAYLDSDGVLRSDANLTLTVMPDSATSTNEIVFSIDNWDEVNNTLYNFTWTPAPESMTVSFDSAGGSVVPANTYAPGDRFGELPVPTRDGCTFLGWINGNVLGGVAVKEDDFVPFNDVTLVAKWAANEFTALPDAFTDVVLWPQESSVRQVVASDGSSVVEFVFDFGDEIVSMSGMTAETACAGYLSFEVGIVQGFGNIEPVVVIDDKEATVRNEMAEKGPEVVWTRYHVTIPDGQHDIGWLFTAWRYYQGGQPFAWIRNVEFEPIAPQKDVFSWADKLVTYHSWITNDLGRFALSYNARVAEDETDYEARLFHAATILAQLGENDAVARCAAQFGYSIDYLGLTVSTNCERDVSSWPSVNEVVDEAFDVALPVITEAYADVSAIPPDWTGSIKLAAEKFHLDEDVYLDLGDVMVIRSALEAAISLLHFAKGYDWTVDYESADAARAEVDARRRMYKLITEQTNFMAKVRSGDSLVASKSWMSAALQRVLDAAAFMRARPAEGDMHFFEYDPALCDEWAQATNLVTKALASLDAAQEVDIAEDVVGSYGSCNTALLPNDGLVQIYLGALFSGGITQDLRPAVNLDGAGKLAVDFAAMKDPTIAGLLPGFAIGTWSGIYSSTTNGVHVFSSEAVPEVVDNEGVAIALKGSKDPELKKNIVDAESYESYREWAQTVRGADGTSVAGTRAVKGSAHAAAAYLLGAERLFENEPTVEIGELAIEERSSGTLAPTLTVAVTVKDGETAVTVNAEKVAAMFEATSDLGDWNGASKLTPTVTPSGTDASGKMTFVVTPGDGASNRAFLRIKR